MKPSDDISLAPEIAKSSELAIPGFMPSARDNRPTSVTELVNVPLNCGKRPVFRPPISFNRQTSDETSKDILLELPADTSGASETKAADNC